MSANLDATTLAWVLALGWTLLHFLWQGALVGAGYAAFRVLARGARPQWRYGGGLAALALLALLPLLTLWQLAPWSGEGLVGASVAVFVGATSAAAPVDGAAAGRIEALLPWIVALWLAGVGVAALRALHAYRRLTRLCRIEAEPMPEWQPRLAELMQRFGVTRPVRLLKSAAVRTPSLIGWLAPVIVIPAGVIVGLTPRQIELVIAHELGHVRRWDYLVNLLQVALETLLFYHPVVHWISREVRQEREACCDDLVLRLGADRVAYAETLATLEEMHHAVPAPAISATGGVLLGRIRRIIGAEPATNAPLSGGQGLLLAVLALAVLLAAQPVTRAVLERGAALADSTPASPTARLAGEAIEMLERAYTPAPVQVAAALPAPVPAAPTATAAMPVPATKPAPERPALQGPAVARPVVHAPRLADDLALEPAPQRPSPSVLAARAPRVTSTVAPFYPRDAAVRGLEGSVTLGFEIDARGRARRIEVLSATESDVFEHAAIAALRGWRFDPDQRVEGRRYVQAFEFALDGARGAGHACETPLGSRICR